MNPDPSSINSSPLADIKVELSTEQRKQLALLRLTTSRGLLFAPKSSSKVSQFLDGAQGGISQVVNRIWSMIHEKLQASPVTAVMSLVMQTWWKQAPLRATGESVSQHVDGVMDDTIKPMIRRYPIAAALLAAGLGAAVVLARRPVGRAASAQVKPVMRRARRWLVAVLLKQLPWKSLLTSLLFATGVSKSSHREASHRHSDSRGETETSRY